MKRIKSLILSLWLASGSFAQVAVNESLKDFGEINRETERLTDFVFTNTGKEKTILLRTDFPQEYNFLFSSKEINPGESATLRVKFNPRKKGKTMDRVQVWFSTMSKPIILDLRANTLFVDNSENPACPDFSSLPVGCCDKNEVTIEVRNAKTGLPVYETKVKLFSDGKKAAESQTDKQGRTLAEMPVKYYFIQVEKEGFAPTDTALYLSRRNNYLVLNMLPVNSELEVLRNTEQEEPAVKVNPIVLADNSDFSEANYKPSHVVFLLDVSGSMKQRGRLEMLKAAMMELYGILRPIDRISIVTFASETEVIHECSVGNDKASLESGLTRIQADGMTMSVKGFKKAYALAEEHFIEEGNNQIIVVSDGAFEMKDKNLLTELAKKYLVKEIKTTLLGVRSSPAASAILGQIALAGNGRHIQLNDLTEDKAILISEVKIGSHKP